VKLLSLRDPATTCQAANREHHRTQSGSFVIFIIGLLLSVSYAQAGTITTWAFQGVTFADGGTLSGSFQFDGVATYSNIDIVTTAGTTSTGDSTGVPLTAYAFTNNGTYLGAQGPNILDICEDACNFTGDELDLYWSDNLGIFGAGLNGPSPVPIDHINSFQAEGVDTRTPITGDVVATAVTTTPEPVPAELTLAGCFGLLVLRSKSRRDDANSRIRRPS
jgi:hypothetical protein